MVSALTGRSGGLQIVGIYERWRDISFKGRTLTFRDTKNHTDRTIPITPHMNTLLESMKDWRMGEYVFGSTGKDGKPVKINEPRRAMQRANKAASSEVTVHGLRRTYATVLEVWIAPLTR